ncbi:MAG: sensor histidine kinase N-terminal domain-containing protein [Nitrosomonadales bacterium]|nr:sensor histidine kinase N-terminal domain-containing protein [Nitrosomonadales bacterium]
MASPAESGADVLSLRIHLINWLLTPLFVLWLFSTIAGYVATLNYANKPYDQVLLQRAQAVAEQLRLGGGRERLEIDLKLPDGSSPTSPDKVFYTVSDREGKKLAGNANLGRPLAYRGGKINPLFSNGERDGAKTRNVSMVFYNPDSKKLYQLHMSETIQQRQALIRGILANIVIPQLLLILIAVAAVWYALKQGLAPLERLRREVKNRSRDDLSQLDGSLAPEEVRPLIDAVNNLLERLQQAMQAQKRFVADAAHQLRTPIAGLKTQSELALRTTDPEQKQQALEHILTSTQHGIRLVNQLMALARNEPGGQGSENFVAINLNQLAQECTAGWISAALEKNIDLGFDGAPAAAEAMGDASSLIEMLNNLIDNAIRYTPASGHITVSVNATAQGSVLSVEDNGPGIDPQHRERVFERFYRVLGTGQSGSGLGLAIVAEVSKRHHATLRLDAGSGGKGTVISIRFPRRPPPAPTIADDPRKSPAFYGGA